MPIHRSGRIFRSTRFCGCPRRSFLPSRNIKSGAVVGYTILGECVGLPHRQIFIDPQIYHEPSKNDGCKFHINLIFNWPNSQIPQCTCSISDNAPFRTEMCTFLFWMEHCQIWSRCILQDLWNLSIMLRILCLSYKGYFLFKTFLCIFSFPSSHFRISTISFS